MIPWYGFPYERSYPHLSRSMITSRQQPATSVHLNFFQRELGYWDFQRIKKDGWEVSNWIRVKESAPSTYFSMIQFPGVYGGIQQLESQYCPQTRGEIQHFTKYSIQKYVLQRPIQYVIQYFALHSFTSIRQLWWPSCFNLCSMSSRPWSSLV